MFARTQQFTFNPLFSGDLSCFATGENVIRIYALGDKAFEQKVLWSRTHNNEIRLF
jgi:hypothetical protein